MNLVFDSTVLSCFARAGLLDLLEKLTRGHGRHVPRAVLDEIQDGIRDHPALAGAEHCAWLDTVPVDSLAELVAFARHARRLVAGSRNVGEASALAWAEVHGTTVLTDDETAVQSAHEAGIGVRRTLALVAEGIRDGLLDEVLAAEVVDRLIQRGGARFPFGAGAFVAWAQAEGLLNPAGS